MTDSHISAHKHSIRHYAEISRSDSCGCFYCCRTFAPPEIAEWIADGDGDDNQTALCPYCGIDSVIGSDSGHPITTEFLKLMNQHWF